MQATLTPEIKSFLDSKYWNNFLNAELAKGLDLEAAVIAAAKAVQVHTERMTQMRRDPQTRKALLRHVATEVWNSVRATSGQPTEVKELSEGAKFLMKFSS
jgi:hypothetical protein